MKTRYARSKPFTEDQKKQIIEMALNNYGTSTIGSRLKLPCGRVYLYLKSLGLTFKKKVFASGPAYEDYRTGRFSSLSK